jgi:hypothetical protein
MTPDEAYDFRHGRKRRRPAHRLTDLQLSEVSCVDVPANAGARHLLFKNLAAVDTSPALPPLPAHVIAAMAQDAVAKVLVRIEASVARADAIAARMTAAPVAKGVDTVAEALAVAAAREERPQQFWADALRDLGRAIAPDLPPADQMHAALGDPRGRKLLDAKLGARR